MNAKITDMGPNDMVLDRFDCKRFTAEDGTSILFMFEDEDTLVLDLCESGTNEDGIPEVLTSIILGK